MMMKLSLILLSSLAYFSIGEETFTCNICPDDLMIGNMDGVVVIEGAGNRSCSFLYDLAEDGVITEEQCSELQPLAMEPCNCTTYVCNICGPGKVSTLPNGIVDLPGDDQGATTCAAIYQVAQLGGFNESYCPTVQDYVQEPCGCSDLATPVPTIAPTMSPTNPQPTASPTAEIVRPPLDTEPPTLSPTLSNSGANTFVSGVTVIVSVVTAAVFVL
eukprot:Nitzschia sp. Nitz4//scaffold242_size29646//11419//12375//NITZ4_008049-RA/size29646-snap-gene-0.69-mRNA-1//-1//CDS//3329543809//2760//frame0